MPRGRRMHVAEDLETKTPAETGAAIAHGAMQILSKSLKAQESKVMAQRIHHVVRTINKDSSFGQDGSIPLLEAENALNQDWLSKGWSLVSCFLVGRNEGQFEICWVLVMNQ